MRILMHAVGLLSFLVAGTATTAGDWPFRRKASPELPNSPEQIARTIDAIEEKILDDGVVVMKRPDVFGQNRMAIYRSEFERAMRQSLKNNDFQFMLNARIARSDQAAFLSETSLGAALTRLRQTNTPSNVIAIDADAIQQERNAQAGIAQDLITGARTRQVLSVASPFGLLPTGQPFQNIGVTGANSLGIEPTVYLDQKKRFFDHLNEIRRTNLGDDVSDSAGYGLYQFRMPVSIQPGEHTLRGHGAVVTATIRHDYGTHFLRNTFRNLVVADLVDQLAPVVFELIRSNMSEHVDLMTQRIQEAEAEIARLLAELAREEEGARQADAVILEELKVFADAICRYGEQVIKSTNADKQKVSAIEDAFRRVYDFFQVPGAVSERSRAAGLTDVERAALDKVNEWVRAPGPSKKGRAPQDVHNVMNALKPVVVKYLRARVSNAEDWKNETEFLTRAEKFFEKTPIEANRRDAMQRARSTAVAVEKQFDKVAQAQSRVGDAKDQLGKLKTTKDNFSTRVEQLVAAALPSTRIGTRVYPIAPTDFDDVFLTDNLFLIARDVRQALITKVPKAGDVRTYLRHQIEAAYELYSHYQGEIPKIFDHIRNRQYASGDGRFSQIRDGDYPGLAAALPGDLKGATDRPLTALCWAVAVDAGLLNDQIRHDMKATLGQNGFACPEADSLDFYLDPPLPEAQDAFTRYVTARWPMVAFAVDPYVDQQNIADAFSQRRDLQLALAYSFATGRVSFRQLTRFTRRLELDAETIALNRTVTSFSHGSDTFGWRFYPRYQTPPNERNNLQTVTNLLLRGGPGRNYQIRNSKLEPGQRELTVIVVMPSFLDHVRFEVATNWFPLHDPDQMKVESARMIKQGKQLTEVRGLLASAEECGHYRPGDLQRLATRIDQVEAMLPLQTQAVQVPYEATSAGFQLFTPGNNAIVPELIGFEGADSISAEQEDTDLLLQCKRVSLHETRVIAGGRVLAAAAETGDAAPAPAELEQDIVSREIVRVTVPKDVARTNIRTVDVATGQWGTKEYVELYLSTPNGVSNRLLVPYGDPSAPVKLAGAQEEEAAPKSGFSLKDANLFVTYKRRPPAGETKFVDYGGTFSPSAIRLEFSDASTPVVPTDLLVTLTFAGKDDEGKALRFEMPAKRNGNAYFLDAARLAQMVEQLVTLRRSTLVPRSGTVAELVTAGITVVPTGLAAERLSGVPRQVDGTLTVQYVLID